MKLHLPKGLFVAVVMACSVAYAATTEASSVTIGSMTITPKQGETIQAYETGEGSDAALKTQATYSAIEGRVRVVSNDDITNLSAASGTLLVGKGSYVPKEGGEAAELSGGQIFFQGDGSGSDMDITNDIYLGAGGPNGYAIRFHDTDKVKAIVSGNITLVDNAAVSVNKANDNNIISGYVSGDYTLKVGIFANGASGSRLTFSGGADIAGLSGNADIVLSKSDKEKTNYTINKVESTGAITVSEGVNLAIGSLKASTLKLDTGAALSWDVAQGTTTTYANSITGNGQLTKTGAGTLKLTGNTPFTGTIDVQAGELRAGGSNITFDVSKIIVRNGSNFTTDFKVSSSGKSKNVAANIDLMSGSTLYNDDGHVTYNGTIRTNIVDPSASKAEYNADGEVTIASFWGKNLYLAGLLEGSGTINLHNTYYTGTDSDRAIWYHLLNDENTFNGTYKLADNGTDNTTGDTINLYIGAEHAAQYASVNLASSQAVSKLILNTSASIVGLDGSDADNIVTTNTESATLSVQQGSFGGKLQDNKNAALALTKTGAGTLTLSGANTYTGGTEIKGGTLKLGSAGALGSGAVEVGAGAVLDVNGQAVTSISGVTLNAGAKLANSGANIWASANQLSGITLLGDATIEATGAFGLVKSGEATSLNLNGHTLTKDGAGNFALMSTTVDGNGKIAIGEGNVLVGYKDVGGASSLSASGTTIELTDTGAFALENDGSSATIAALTGTGGSVVNNGVIELTGTDDYSFAAAVSGSGSIKVTGAGTHTYTGSSLTNSIHLAANSGFVFGSSTSMTYGKVISGAGDVTKTGTGTLTLSGANTYSGGTAINGGVLVADNASALGTGPVTIGGGTLKLNQALTVASLAYTSGTINLNGKTLTVTGALTSNNAKPTIAGGEGSVLAVKGNLAVTGGVNDGFHLQLAANSKATVELYGKDNQVGIVDFSASEVTGTLKLMSGSSTTITNSGENVTAQNNAGALWLSSSSKVLLEDTAKLTFCGTTVTGRGSNSSIASAVSDGGANVTVWDKAEITDADIEVTEIKNAGNVNSKLTNSTLTNSASGAITLTNGGNTLTALNAAKGNITLQNISKQELSTLAIAAGKTVAVYTGTDTANVGTLTVSGTGSTATFGAEATLSANLVLGTGAEVTLKGALTMGGSLTLSEGLTLNYSDAVTAIATLAEDTNQVVLFTGVDKLYLGSNTEASGILTSADKVDISTYLTSDAFKSSETGDYYLGYDGSDVYVEFVAKADDPGEDPSTPEGGGNVPEPTTGALSLLGLAALAMRRRRRA